MSTKNTAAIPMEPAMPHRTGCDRSHVMVRSTRGWRRRMASNEVLVAPTGI